MNREIYWFYTVVFIVLFFIYCLFFLETLFRIVNFVKMSHLAFLKTDMLSGRYFKEVIQLNSNRFFELKEK